MASSYQIRKLATDPMAHARFRATGQLPREPEPPSSPLIDLLLKIPPRELSHLRGVRVGPELGYSGSRAFHSASQALLWLRPSSPADSVASESWRDKRFAGALHLDDLLACCAARPEGIETRLARLLSSAARSASSAGSSLSSEAGGSAATSSEQGPRP